MAKKVFRSPRPKSVLPPLKGIGEAPADPEELLTPGAGPVRAIARAAVEDLKQSAYQLIYQARRKRREQMLGPLVSKQERAYLRSGGSPKVVQRVHQLNRKRQGR